MRSAAENRRNVRDSHVKEGSRPAGLFRIAARTAQQRRKRAERERRRYTKERLLHLQSLHPGLPPDVLDRAALRQLSVAVRRAGATQSTLAAFREVEYSSGHFSKEPLCVEHRAVDARGEP